MLLKIFLQIKLVLVELSRSSRICIEGVQLTGDSMNKLVAIAKTIVASSHIR